MLEGTDKSREYAYYHIDRKITSLYKQFLILLEDLQLDPNQYSRLRKRILDYGNDSKRELFDIFDKGVDFKLKG